MEAKLIRLDELVEFPQNAKSHDLGSIHASIGEWGYIERIVVNETTGHILSGHGRTTVLRQLQSSHSPAPEGIVEDNGSWMVPVDFVSVPESQEGAVTVALNRTVELGGWDNLKLAELLQEVANSAEVELKSTGYDGDDLDELLREIGQLEYESAPNRLSDKFIVPPFTVLDARQGYWNERKRAWIGLGIQSGEGRGEASKLNTNSLWERSNRGGKIAESSHVSIFDPVLTEVIYTWYTGEDDSILDPFAGGSVRGVVASYLGRDYLGVDLCNSQIEANYKQAATTSVNPKWIQGDSVNIDKIIMGKKYDFIFSCPPYYNLESYSDDRDDLSNMEDYGAFLNAYKKIITKCCDALRDNRFACFVVGDIRGKDGNYRGFVSDTIQAFCENGLSLYNYAILLTPIGNLPMRVARIFNSGRKLGKAHQDVLIFVKGDANEAANRCQDISEHLLEERLSGMGLEPRLHND